ncbi:MAG: metallophosphoesterase [Bryobacteraceae bacterium]|nr:metallophosphoesterase [Bryobacteraceae bacterium]
MNEILRRNLPNILIALAAALVQWQLAARLARAADSAGRHGKARTWRALGFVLIAWTLLMPVVFGTGLQLQLPGNGAQWAMAATLLYLATAFAGGAAYFLTSRNVVNPSRRQALKAISGAIVALPAGFAAAGIIRAWSRPELREISIAIPGLPKDLQGLRIAQLTDIHYGPFFSMRDLEWAVAMANEAKPNLTVVTGDLITRRSDNLEECVWILRGLKADAGVYGCHGNHEVYARAVNAATALGRAAGIQFLRSKSATLNFGSAKLALTGVDYQPQASRYLRTVRPQPGAVNILLSHNPDVFGRAALLGFDLTLAGHTHGGQINVEILHEHLNVARFFTPWVYGLYRQGGRSIYVSGGLGTVGAPVRLGAPPEVTVVRLCAG